MTALALELGNLSSRAEASYDFDEFEIMKFQQAQQTAQHFRVIGRRAKFRLVGHR